MSWFLCRNYLHYIVSTSSYPRFPLPPSLSPLSLSPSPPLSLRTPDSTLAISSSHDGWRRSSPSAHRQPSGRWGRSVVLSSSFVISVHKLVRGRGRGRAGGEEEEGKRERGEEREEEKELTEDFFILFAFSLCSLYVSMSLFASSNFWFITFVASAFWLTVWNNKQLATKER